MDPEDDKGLTITKGSKEKKLNVVRDWVWKLLLQNI